MRNGQVALSPGQGWTVRGTVHRAMVEGARLFAAPDVGPLHHAAARRGPPPRSGEER
ncbi:MAG: hypothetical protein QOK17_1848 [Sphingomonadales bacterium]|jgi:hypothetical protein|nr:hypothetical protein [Sphingomonadales bacterium]